MCKKEFKHITVIINGNESTILNERNRIKRDQSSERKIGSKNLILVSEIIIYVNQQMSLLEFFSKKKTNNYQNKCKLSRNYEKLSDF
jgi:hypothetical protein